MTSYPEFQLEVAQNQYLAPGATQVDAISQNILICP